MFWIALTVFVVAPLAALVYAIAQVVGLWRSFRGFTRAFGEGTAEFAARLDALAARQPDVERLGPSVEGLQRSNAQLSVLLNALGRVREEWTGLVAIYPKK